jgi:C4-dicarboxylate-specific signal transduction histidine kinase
LQIFYGQSIRRQLVAAALALLLSITAAGVWSANRTTAERRDEVRRETASIAVMAAAQLEQYFAGLDAMASAVARHPVVMSLERDRIDRFFADLLRNQPLVTNLVLTSPDGRVLGVAAPLPAGFEQVTWGYIAEVVRMKQPVVSNLTIMPVSGRSIAIFGYPVRDERDAVSGVLGLGIDLTRLQTVFASIPLPDGSVITVSDHENRVIARSRDADRFIGEQSGPPSIEPEAARRVSLRTDLDGVERFSAGIAVRGGAWTVSAGIPTHVVNQRLQSRTRNVSIIVVAFAAWIALWLVTAWQTTLHLNRFRSAAEHMAGGDLSPMDRIQTPNLEFAQLQDTFITMATNLRDARGALDRQMEQRRKMNEDLQSLQRQVVRQERLTAVGLLVSGVAHEVNNPLQAILGTAELLERHPTTPPELIEEMVFLKTQAGRARDIIRNLSRFSSQQSGPPALVDLRDVIGEVVQLRRRNLEIATIALDVQTTTVRKVYANFTELEQVTLNFVINAQQSLEGSAPRGRILIRLFDVGRRVRLEVLDNGPGVKPEDEPKLFQPFFTTKPVGKGTGLGLSVSYGIIDSYGGTIGYTGNEWGGATFFFELPAREEGHDKSNDRPAVLQRSV